ncbi:inositol 1,4,5-trisphosphate receptor-interacting protein-like [Lethenteron reissneri]|uniref:inositol 1,4,5-trisphosphate receptor-interacting protein-like n=1 Tax=Lethenteron reissneri TaxID=7753 RepID=UPI002AB638E0|nr:inositol 1,4,5-trisphosphate receptor-interacting protein-like [Lethenteron reissneri]
MMASSIELDRFYSEEVEFPPRLLTSHIKTAESEVGTLLDGMGSILRPDIDPLIEDIVYTGSSYEGLKVKGKMELDVMIVISHPEFKFIPMTSHYSGYRKIEAERQPLTQLQATGFWKSESPFHSFEKDFTSNGYLIPSKIYQWFQSLADRAVKENKLNFFTKFVGNYPARTLILNISPGVDIYVDLVPAIKIEGDLYAVAKPLKTSPELHLWRLSFSVFEKKILRQHQSSFHLNALKILKYLREHDPRLEETSQFASGICSYHLKTASLHLLAQRPDTPEGLHECLHQLMDFLLECMQKRELNHFFTGNPSSLARNAQVPSSITHRECCLNLFGSTFMNWSTLNQARERLIRIKRSLPAVIQQHSGLAPGRSPRYNDIAISRYNDVAISHHGDIVLRRQPSFQNRENVRGPLSLHVPPPQPLQVGNLGGFSQSEARTLVTSQKAAMVTGDPPRGQFAATSEGGGGGGLRLYSHCCCCLLLFIVVVCCFGLLWILSTANSVSTAGATFW